MDRWRDLPTAVRLELAELVALDETDRHDVDLLASLRRPRWMADGLCREPEHAGLDWVPSAPHAKAEAQRAVCARCLVRAECLTFALEHDEVGIWGGLNDRERRALGREAA